MKSRASELAVGIFVILFGIALFFIAMRVSGLVGSNLSDRYEMSATFDNVNGLKPRAKVTMSGVKIGQVDQISLDPVTRLATVSFSLDGKLHLKSFVTVATIPLRMLRNKKKWKSNLLRT